MLEKIKKFFSKFTFKSVYEFMIEDAKEELSVARKQKHEGVTQETMDCVVLHLHEATYLRDIVLQFLDKATTSNPLYPTIYASLKLQEELEQITKWRKAYKRECRAKKKGR